MSLNPGARLGPYEIVGPLGAGGMGEVYDARDTRLDRRVAIKILRPELAAEPDRRARFEREARAIASINHPHICTLHDVGHQDGVAFLVMEKLDGQTLADRLVRGPLPFAEALTAAGQIADALDRAHGQGIVHRDLKPANVMLTRSGVKLLDFGLARLLEADTTPLDGLTRTAALTQEGTIVGTLQYMAPEQLEGRPTDARTDLFAFGAILYEMVTGRRAFDAPSQAGIVGAILHAEVPQVSSAPPAFARVLNACLAKKPEDRWSSAHDVRLLLQGIAVETPSGVAAAAHPVSPRRDRLGWIAAAVALVALAAVLAMRAGWQAPAAPYDVLSIVPPAGTTFARGESPQVSPDGREIAFVATDATGHTLLYLRARGAATARALPGTDDATLPFWAPDSRRLGFFARSVLKTVDIGGGTPRTLAGAPVPRGGTWSKDDMIVFVPYPNVQAQQIPAGGGTPATVKGADDRAPLRWFPSFLPDGRHYLFLAIDRISRQGVAIHVASLDSTDTRELVKSSASATYAEPGVLLFRRDAALMAQRFDASTQQLQGQPMTAVDTVGYGPVTYQTFSSASPNVLAYQEPEPGWHLTWFDRTGRRLGAVLPTAGQYNGLCLSKDGARLVYDLVDADHVTNLDLWSLDVATGVTTRLTFDSSADFYPVCSQVGDEIAFSSLRAGPPNVFRLLVTAPGSEKMLLQTPTAKVPTDWSRDGTLLVYSAFAPPTGWDVWILPLSGAAPFAFAASPAEERNAKMSPGGRFIAYTLIQGERTDVYVQPFPANGAKWQISRDGGQHPAWSRDGKTLFYVSIDKKIMAVDVVTQGTEFGIGRSRVAVDTRVEGRERTNQGSPFVVTPDGERFAVSTAAEAVVPMTVVLNWQAQLGR